MDVKYYLYALVTSVAVPILLKLLSSSRTDIAIQVLQAIEKAEG